MNTHQLLVSTLVLAGLLFRGFIGVLPAAGLVHFGFYRAPLWTDLIRTPLKVCKLQQQVFSTRAGKPSRLRLLKLHSVPTRKKNKKLLVERLRLVPGQYPKIEEAA